MIENFDLQESKRNQQSALAKMREALEILQEEGDFENYPLVEAVLNKMAREYTRG
tara:strand:+ start:15696 stop:15860 length:165 start_codon:yes stop_codon:yes gene_type:complete